jgi:2-polyprenyl-3-methyl-5-hydroxy-6-metoxy-1,4-benzoquinol methylase
MQDESAAWNAEAHEWVDRIREGMGGRVHAHDESLYGLLPPPRGLTLDVGCGEGRISRELRARGYDVVGYDASETLVEEARRADPDGRYEVARIDALPVDDGVAQLLVCVNVLPHIHDLAGAARELARALAPGGTLLIGTIHPVAQAGTFDEELGELRVRGYFTHEAHAVPLGEHHVFHQHRTIEDYLRTFLATGMTLSDLREVPGASGEVPLYLDLVFVRQH